MRRGEAKITIMLHLDSSITPKASCSDYNRGKSAAQVSVLGRAAKEAVRHAQELAASPDPREKKANKHIKLQQGWHI